MYTFISDVLLLPSDNELNKKAKLFLIDVILYMGFLIISSISTFIYY